MTLAVVVDVEHEITCLDSDKDKWDYSPYNPSNRLVSAGWKFIQDGKIIGNTEYRFFNHAEGSDEDSFNVLQAALSKADVFVGHNAKHDYNWLHECGFTLPDTIHCTFIAEYVLARGLSVALDLGSVAERYHVTQKKGDIVSEYLDQGITFFNIPKPVVLEYGIADVDATADLYIAQLKEYGKSTNIGLVPTRDLSYEFCSVLSAMERNGIAIDQEALASVKQDYENERLELKQKLRELTQAIMGDYPYNLASPEQLSQIIYSYKIVDKVKWIEQLNIGVDERGKDKRRPKMHKLELEALVKDCMDPVYRMKAKQCPVCEGLGKIQKVKKDGTNHKRQNKCSNCGGHGLLYEPTTTRAGFGIQFGGVEDASIGGFSTDKHTLTRIHSGLDESSQAGAREYLSCIMRLNAIDTYIDSFCVGIQRAVQKDGLLHAKFNQCITKTGRLSSTDPNLQNQPRGKTFPIRKVFTSRFPNGELCDTDFSQLEFRAAVHLARDERGREHILQGIDVHNQTAKILSDAGQKTDRQAAKSHCVPMNTEALTRDGWKKYDELTVGEDILTFNPVTKQNEWKPILALSHYKAQDVYRLRNGHWEMFATSDHKWFGRKRVDNGQTREYQDRVFTTSDINQSYEIRTSAYCPEGALNISDDEAAILGWLWMDGHTNVKDNIVRCATIVQSTKKGTIFTKLVELLKRVGINTDVKMQSNQAHYFNIPLKLLRDIYKKCNFGIEIDYVKFVLSLNVNARRAWLQAVIDAEGTDRGFGVVRIAQNVGGKCEAIKLAAILEGYEIRVTQAVFYTNKLHEQITLRTRQYVTGQRLKIDKYSVEDVWCPMTENGTWVMRQDKFVSITGNSFKPLYGGLSGTPAEVVYYKQFLQIYNSIAKWHEELGDEAVRTKCIRLPTGREYAFPFAKRNHYGGVSNKTQIVNFPVQGFATADIVPAAICVLARAFKKHKLRSLLVLTVHDSVVVDIYPGEKEKVVSLMKKLHNMAEWYLKTVHGIDMYVPLMSESKVGHNLLQMETV